jgi:hypothetical protein
LILSESGQFALEVLVKSSPRAESIGAREAEIQGGLAFLKLEKDETFVIHLVNNAQFDVAVELTLDGLDSFWFHADKSGLWFIPAAAKGSPGDTTVIGWQVDDSSATEFTVVPFRKSVAFRTGTTGRVGIIGARFFRAYQLDEKIADEDANGGGPTKGFDLGIGDGQRIGNHVETLKRKIGKPRAFVTVRYEKPKP